MPGSNNFVQHNPTEANQEDDASFEANSLTSGGIGLDAIMPSNWMNKRWYQDSTMVAAIALMMSNKGYNMLDSAGVPTLAGILANIITSADLKPNQIVVPYSPTPNFDCSLANGFRFPLSADVTSSTLVNSVAGQIYTFFIVSANPGVLNFVWPANVISAPDVKTESSGNLMVFQFISDGTNLFPVPTFVNFLKAEIDAINAALLVPAVQSNVTGARGFGVIYNNSSTNRTMTVSMTFTVAGGTGRTVTAFVNGSVYARQSALGAGGVSVTGSLSIVVPGGGNYELTYDSPVVADEWYETV